MQKSPTRHPKVIQKSPKSNAPGFQKATKQYPKSHLAVIHKWQEETSNIDTRVIQTNPQSNINLIQPPLASLLNSQESSKSHQQIIQTSTPNHGAKVIKSSSFYLLFHMFYQISCLFYSTVFDFNVSVIYWLLRPSAHCWWRLLLLRSPPLLEVLFWFKQFSPVATQWTMPGQFSFDRGPNPDFPQFGETR